jgi:hypothetical protein
MKVCYYGTDEVQHDSSQTKTVRYVSTIHDEFRKKKKNILWLVCKKRESGDSVSFLAVGAREPNFRSELGWRRSGRHRFIEVGRAVS